MANSETRTTRPTRGSALASPKNPLQAALRRTPIAANGPVVAEILQRHGLTAALTPDVSFHMKPQVRTIVAWRQAR